MSYKSRLSPKQDKMFSKHVKKLTEIPPFSECPGRDIIQKLRHYKLRSHLASPTSSTRYRQISDSSHASPDPGLLRTVQAIETQSLTSAVKNLSAMSNRLSIGNPYKFSATQKISLNPEPEDFESKELENFKRFISNLQAFKSHKFDLELLYGVSRGNSEVSQSGLGNFYSLKEKLEKLNVKGNNHQAVIEGLSRIQRDILRGMISKGAQDEAVLVELLWRIYLQIFDDYIQAADEVKNQAKISAQEEVKKEKEKMLTKKKLTKEKFKRKHSELIEVLKKQEANIAYLTESKALAERISEKRAKKIEKLTKLEVREATCIEMNRILGKVNQYMTESEEEKLTQSQLLKSVSEVMALIQEVCKDPVINDVEIQTDLKMPDAPFEAHDCPVVSPHPYYLAYDSYKLKKPWTIDKIMQTCETVLETVRSDLPFTHQFLFHLLKKDYSTQKAVSISIFSALRLAQETDSNKGRVLSYLFGNPSMLSHEAEVLVFEILKAFLDSETVPLVRLLEFMQKYLMHQRGLCEKILSSLNWMHNEIESQSIQVVSILCRLQIGLSKQKKRLKAMMEALENKKEGGIYRHVFVDWVRNTLGCWVSEAEIQQLIDYCGGNLINSTVLSQTLVNLDIIQKIKGIYVDKYELILLFLSEYTQKMNHVFESFEPLAQVKDVHEYFETASKLAHDPLSSQSLLVYIESLLGIPLKSVINSRFELSLVKLEEVPSLKNRKSRKRN